MLLAALPATPVQLAHACYQLGFDIVVPASWGDELVAHAVLEDLRLRDREPVIQCTCPLVYERLLANGQHLLPSMVQTAAPAVAAARYARHAFAPRHLNITYVGACPGAAHPSIDERCVPDELLRSLAESDISIADMPTVFDSVLPPDRRRFVSLPGGCPTQEALWQASDGRMLREVTQPTFSTDLAQTLVWREHVMVDVAPSLGCACAGSCSRLGARSGRVAVMAIEPPRASQPVTNFKPEYAAPSVQPVVTTEPSNGDAPRITQAPGPHEAAEPVVPAASERAAETTVAAVTRARSRVRTATPLPRAYLAKRRHIAGGSATPEATLPDESEPYGDHAPLEERAVAEPGVAPNEPLADVHAQPQLLEVAAEPALATEAVLEAAVPNEFVPEPIETSRPIAVHVEPEPAQNEEAPPQQAQVAEIDVKLKVPQDLQGLLVLDDSLSSEGVVAATRTEAHHESSTPAVDISVAVEERVAEPSAVEEPGGPLRVEVEIFEEPESEPQLQEVLVSDAALSAESSPVADTEPEMLEQPGRAWGDFLIALWLVLVASAVIAALLWRR
ncbi:MAG: [Fe-Fe] hydrogenase large subunit C-terminal domain-containing protein [Gemmatimonadaceae bacterium]